MLSQRLKVAIPLILVVFLVFFLPGTWRRAAFSILAAAILFTANHEGCALAGFKPLHREEILLQLYAVALIANAWTAFLPDPVLLLAFLLLAFVLQFNQKVTAASLAAVAKTLLIGVTVCWSLSFLARIFYSEVLNGPLCLAYLVVITKVADIGAYFVGTLTAKLPGGNHKLAIHVSPKKSWEGLFGGIASSIIASVLFCIFATSLKLTFPVAILLGFLAATLGLVGDLCESLLKRAASAKDSGVIPGLGGALDVVDSLLPMGIIIYYAMNWLSRSACCIFDILE